MNTAVIGMGSNIAPEENIHRAKQLIQEHHKILTETSLLQTKPISPIPQADFLNGAILIAADLDYKELLAQLKKIEVTLGRQKDHTPMGPRTIDLDVIVWNNRVVHKDFYSRNFVRTAVHQLLPELKA